MEPEPDDAPSAPSSQSALAAAGEPQLSYAPLHLRPGQRREEGEGGERWEGGRGRQEQRLARHIIVLHVSSKRQDKGVQHHENTSTKIFRNASEEEPQMLTQTHALKTVDKDTRKDQKEQPESTQIDILHLFNWNHGLLKKLSATLWPTT